MSAEQQIYSQAENFASEIIGQIKCHEFEGGRGNIDFSLDEIIDLLQKEYSEDALRILRNLEKIGF